MFKKMTYESDSTLSPGGLAQNELFLMLEVSLGI